MKQRATVQALSLRGIATLCFLLAVGHPAATAQSRPPAPSPIINSPAVPGATENSGGKRPIIETPRIDTPRQRPERPGRNETEDPDRHRQAGADRPIFSDLQRLIDAARQSRAEFLKRQQEQRPATSESERAARAQLRDRLRPQHAAVITVPNELRPNTGDRSTAVGAPLKEHGKVVESAQVENKEPGHSRKDN